MRALLSALIFLVIGLPLMAQVDDAVKARHLRILQLYEAEDHGGTVREVDAQLKACEGTAYADSLHLYLYKYARAYRKLKDASAGAAAGERILALVKSRRNTNNELEALFELSWYYYDIGELRECARVDSMAVAAADGDIRVDQRQRGRARQFLAFDHSIIGDHARSAKWALGALEAYSKADSVPAAQWAESHTAVGAAYWHLGRIRAAEEQYKKALEYLADATDLPAIIRKVSANGNLGVMWQNAGDLARAKTYYYKSLRYSDQVIAATEDPFTRDEAIVNRSRTYLNLATVYGQLGDDGRARELLDIAWKDRSGVLEPGDPQLLTIRDRMAEIELGQGNLEKAEPLVREYLDACERRFGRISEEYVQACSKLGEIAQRKGESQRADSLFTVSISAGLADPDAGTNITLATTYRRRARANLDRGRAQEAMDDLQNARRILVNTYDSAHYKVAGIDVLLAEAAFKAGDPEKSLRHSASAIHLLNGRLDALTTSRVPLAFPDPHDLPDALYWKVIAGRARAKGLVQDPQWNTDLDLAILSLARNKAAVEDERSKLLLIGAQKRLFDLALDVAYEGYERSRQRRDAERFLTLSEADRSILLKNRLNEFAGLRFSGVPDSITTREQELLAALDLQESDRSSATQLGENERAYAQFLARLEKDHPQYFTLRYGEPMVSLDDVGERLIGPERDLLIYATTTDHLYMMVITTDTIALLRTDRTGLAGTIDAMNDAVRDRRMESFIRLSRVLYGKVFEPVEALLRKEELLIVPDGELQTVNFDALLFEPADRDVLSAHFLIQRHAIAYLLSTTTALQFAGLERQGPSDVLAFAPGFSDDLKKHYLSHVKDTVDVDRAFLNYVRQPFAQRAAEDLRGLFSARVMLGREASERRFRELAERHGILHLGTHAEMNGSSPMYSRLVLSKDGAGVEPDADGYLHAYELYELDLRAQLAVLTACETGIGENEAGEGVRSLGYSFAYAGCPSLITSLWEIDEKVSSEIITRFYKYLADGMPKHRALRQAKLDHLATAPAELAAPFYWAGMVLVGDVRPVAQAWWPRYGWWLLAGLIALVGALWWWRRSD